MCGLLITQILSITSSRLVTTLTETPKTSMTVTSNRNTGALFKTTYCPIVSFGPYCLFTPF